jgi:hypothetical protein
MLTAHLFGLWAYEFCADGLCNSYVSDDNAMAGATIDAFYAFRALDLWGITV